MHNAECRKSFGLDLYSFADIKLIFPKWFHFLRSFMKQCIMHNVECRMHNVECRKSFGLDLYSFADFKTDFSEMFSLFAEPYNPKRLWRFHVFWIVGPLSPVLISRYAKNHSPDDFCLRHSVFFILHSTFFIYKIFM